MLDYIGRSYRDIDTRQRTVLENRQHYKYYRVLGRNVSCKRKPAYRLIMILSRQDKMPTRYN